MRTSALCFTNRLMVTIISRLLGHSQSMKIYCGEAQNALSLVEAALHKSQFEAERYKG